MIEVGVLLADCRELPEDDSWLDPEDAECLRRIRVPGRRLEFRLDRWTTKRAVAAWLGKSDNLSKEVEVSVSHRDGRAVCAVAPAGTRLGCNLERIEPRSELFLQDCFVPSEIEMVLGEPVEQRALLANLIWSAKESALKALNTGLHPDARNVEVRLLDLSAKDWGRLEVIQPATGEVFHGWWRRDEGWLVTVVSDPAPASPGYLTAQPTA